jgi:hypothetical protein
VLANGPVYDVDGDLHAYEIPTEPETWPMAFFVGGPKTETTTGYVILLDGDMEFGSENILEDGDAEDPGTDVWTAGEVAPS